MGSCNSKKSCKTVIKIYSVNLVTITGQVSSSFKLKRSLSKSEPSSPLKINGYDRKMSETFRIEESKDSLKFEKTDNNWDAIGPNDEIN